jgi:hypothetical protein
MLRKFARQHENLHQRELSCTDADEEYQISNIKIMLNYWCKMFGQSLSFPLKGQSNGQRP